MRISPISQTSTAGFKANTADDFSKEITRQTVSLTIWIK